MSNESGTLRLQFLPEEFTQLKNLNVTRRIIKEIAAVAPNEFFALKTLKNYNLANKHCLLRFLL